MFGSEYYCGCVTDYGNHRSTYCEMHDPSKPWAAELNNSIHTIGLGGPDGQLDYRYIGGAHERDLHNIFWKMGGPKPVGVVPVGRSIGCF